jgi:hypothetical protein
MKKQIVRVSALQTSKVMAAMYFVISLPILALSAIPAWLSGQGSTMWFMLILGPVLYTLFGFLFTLLGAWIYNLVAERIGGFEFTTAEVGSSN